MPRYQILANERNRLKKSLSLFKNDFVFIYKICYETSVETQNLFEKRIRYD